ncbi:hypothetical protein IIA28_21030 [candidate division KSB1 bacterium]|nr:hypothetical protein [candidate division KSB1 bacterium]
MSENERRNAQCLTAAPAPDLSRGSALHHVPAAAGRSATMAWADPLGCGQGWLSA